MSLERMNIWNRGSLLLCILFIWNCASSKSIVPFSKENTTYIISSIVDLHGGTLNVPNNCTLDFRGGRIVNGRIICNHTTFKGNPFVEDLLGTIVNQEFHSSWVRNEEKFRVLCQIEANRIVLDEDLLLRTHQAHDFKSSVLDGAGHSIKVDYDLFGLSALIRCFDTVKCIENIHFDFCHHEFHSIAIWFPKRTESLLVNNVSFSNLANNSVRKYGFEGIGVSVKEGQGVKFKRDIKINVSGISAFNMKALTDNTDKDGESTMTIVYVTCNAPSNARILDVVVKDCDFKEIVVFNKDGKTVANDAACVYVHQDVTSVNSKVQIRDISGYNFGRRLVKTDGGNLLIENIKGESYNGGSVCLVGCNNGGISHSANNAYISDLSFKGKISNVVACMVDDSVIKNISAEFTDYISPRVLSGVLFVGDDAGCQVDGIKVRGKGYLFSSTSQTRVVLRNVKLTTDDSITGIHHLFNTIDIKSLELSDFVFDIGGTPPLLTTYQNANPSISRVNSHIVLRNGTINVNSQIGGPIIKDYSTRHPHSLSIENVNINVKRGTAPAISISSPTLNSFDVNNVEVSFEKVNDSAKVMDLECNNTAKYSLSKITCGTKLSSSPISISGSPQSKVSMKRITVNGRVSVKGDVQVSSK